MRRLLVVLFVLWSTNAQAQAPDMARLIDDSLRWIAANSDYRYEDMKPAPTWSEMTPQQFRVQVVNLQINGDPSEIVGIYVCTYKAFYFNNTFELGDLLSRSFVVHEMVHHGQCVKHLFSNDDCAAEREAYALQAKWLRSQIPAQPRFRDWIVKTAAVAEKAADGICGVLGPR